MFNIMDIIVIIIILLSVLLGYKKGFVRTAMNLLSFFAAIGLALMFYKPLAIILTENTGIDDWIIDNLTNKAENEISGETYTDYIETAAETENSGVNSEKNEEGFTDIISMLENLPATITKNFAFEEVKNNAKQEMAYKISELIMNLLSLIIIYVVVKVTLIIATFILDGIMKFPILKQLNEILGMGLGAVVGFLQVYVAFAVITFLSSICDIGIVVEMIKISSFARALYENNVIINLLL